MIIRILHFVLGYLSVEISGEFCERMLNLLSLHKISVWGIDRRDDKIFLLIKIRDYKKIRKIRGKTKIKIKITDRHGLPFFIKRNRLRYGFFSGILMFFLIVYVLNLFVWRIEIVGNQTVEAAEIIKICEKIGLRSGIKKSAVDSYKMRDELLLNSDKLAWASVNLEGSVVTVNVSEIKNSAENSEYCNIVSDFNAVIKDIKVQKGSAEVLKGDAVQKGDLLISGVVSVEGNTYFTNATGVITAEVEEKIPISVSINDVQKITAGRAYKKYAVDFFNVTFPLYLGKENRYYDYISTKKAMYLFGKEMPISLYSLEISPYTPYVYHKSTEAITAETEQRFKKMLEEMGVEDARITNVSTETTDTHCITTYTVKYLKNIGIKEKILF